MFRLKALLERFENVQVAVPAVLVPLMKPFMTYCDDAFKPGVTALTWASTNLESCMFKKIYCKLSNNVFIIKKFAHILI